MFISDSSSSLTTPINLSRLLRTLLMISIAAVCASAVSPVDYLESGTMLSAERSQTKTEDLRRIEPGQTVERRSTPNEVHGWEIKLEAGTTVEITFGPRELIFQLSALVPEDDSYTVPGNKIPRGKDVMIANAGPPGWLVETAVIVAERTGKYIIRADLSGYGDYSFTVGMPRMTSERDRDLAAAGALFVKIRRAYLANRPIAEHFSETLERAAIYRRIDDKKSLARSLVDVAFVSAQMGRWVEAVEAYKEAIAIFRSLNSPVDIMAIAGMLSGLSTQLGDFQSALDLRFEALSIARALGEKSKERDVLHNIGVAYHFLGDEERTREYYEQSLAVGRTIVQESADKYNTQALTLGNLGNLLRGVEANEVPLDIFDRRTTEDRLRALRYYQQALELALRVKAEFPGAFHREAYSRLQIGNTYKELGNYDEAERSLNTALELYTANNTVAGKIYSNLGLGNLFVAKGEYERGFRHYDTAIELMPLVNTGPYETKYLKMIATGYAEAGRPDKALAMLERTLSICRERAQNVIAASALYDIATIERDRGNFANARARIEEAIATIESIRARQTSQELRTSYFATARRYYEFYADLLMMGHRFQPENGLDRLAFETSERSKSRSLLDLLNVARIDASQGVDPDLLRRERELRDRLSETAYRQSRLLIGKHSKEEADGIAKEIAELSDRYSSVQSEIRVRSPKYSALTEPTSLNTKQIQELLDSGTVLLEYSLGERRSFVWAVTPDSVKAFELPARDVIVARSLKYYELLTARNRGESETAAGRRDRLKKSDDDLQLAANELSETILGPVARELGTKRIVVVAEGALNYVPLAALPKPRSSGSGVGLPISAEHELVTLPSASILPLLREDAVDRRPTRLIAVFADPVFEPGDSRLQPSAKRTAETNNAASSELVRTIRDVGLGGNDAFRIPRLPFSRREADSIFKLVADDQGLRRVDFQASKQNVFESGIDKFRIIHFATHGLLNGRNPELSGIILSLVNKGGGDVDGFLRLQDVYRLRLSADLVVLSACNTALGKEVKGEGLIGLTRGFMYAGAPRVIASLWKVDDAATATFMAIFYRKMLGENMRPAAALRAAQVEMMKTPRWSAPYYWAPFILQGEWK